MLGRSATVVVPEHASRAKVDRLRSFPVDLVLAGDGYDAAEAHALDLARGGGVFVSPYNDPHVIAGQRTIAVEIGAALDGPLTIVVPVGGGGLVAGVALWAAGRDDVRVVGVEAVASRAISGACAPAGSSTCRSAPRSGLQPTRSARDACDNCARTPEPVASACRALPSLRRRLQAEHR